MPDGTFGSRLSTTRSRPSSIPWAVATALMTWAGSSGTLIGGDDSAHTVPIATNSANEIHHRPRS